MRQSGVGHVGAAAEVQRGEFRRRFSSDSSPASVISVFSSTSVVSFGKAASCFTPASVISAPQSERLCRSPSEVKNLGRRHRTPDVPAGRRRRHFWSASSLNLAAEGLDALDRGSGVGRGRRPHAAMPKTRKTKHDRKANRHFIMRSLLLGSLVSCRASGGADRGECTGERSVETAADHFAAVADRLRRCKWGGVAHAQADCGSASPNPSTSESTDAEKRCPHKKLAHSGGTRYSKQLKRRRG